MYVQRIVDSDDKEFDEKVEQKLRKISRFSRTFRKQKEDRRCSELGRFKSALEKLNANKYSILGTATALGAVGVGAYEVLGLSEEAVASMGVIDALTAGGFIGAAGLTIKGIVGKGFESTDEYKARKAEEAKKKADAKAGKQFDSEEAIKAEAKIIAKKHEVDEDKAMELAKHKVEKRKQEAKRAAALERGKQAEKFAKKEGVSVDRAKTFIAEKHNVSEKEVLLPSDIKEA